MKTLIAIPALNEQSTIADVIRRLSEYYPLEDILVVNDGSTDATAQVARDAGVRVVTLAVNLGVGAAMGTAYRYAAIHGYERMAQFDADGQHRAEHLAELFAGLDHADIVVGSRFAAGGRFESSAIRRLVQRVIARFVSAYSRTKLTDVTSGFRASNVHAIELFSLHYPVEWLGDTVESLILASRQGLKLTEVPVTMNERAGGIPSQSVFRASMYTGRILLILVLALFRSAPPIVKKRKRRAAA